MTRFLIAAARPLEFLLGIVFIAAALLKAQDANLFAAQIHGYGVVPYKALLGPIALVTLWFETFLGIAMLLGLRLKMLVLALVQCMLVGFTALIAYAWLAHGLEDCGCFGKIKFPPQAAVTKNVIMMIAAAAAWRGIRLHGAPAHKPAVWKALAAVLLASGTIAWSIPQLYTLRPATVAVEGEGEGEREGEREGKGGNQAAPPPPAKASPFAGMVVEADTGEKFDLSKGRYLVAMLSMTCEHCMASVSFLNDLYMNPDFPPLVGIVYEPEPGDIDDFRAKANPMFPFHSLGDKLLDFMALVADAPPRLAYIKDGEIVKAWDPVEPDFAFPSEEEVLAATREGATAP